MTVADAIRPHADDSPAAREGSHARVRSGVLEGARDRVLAVDLQGVLSAGEEQARGKAVAGLSGEPSAALPPADGYLLPPARWRRSWFLGYCADDRYDGP